MSLYIARQFHFNFHQMGFSFRRSVSFGPMRVNFSSRGIGYSVGVKGARVGVNRRGTYVSLGAGGIQYRRQFSHQTSPTGNVSGPLPMESLAPVHTITSAEVSQITDVDSQDFINELAAKGAKMAYALPGAAALAALLWFGLQSFFGQVAREEKWLVPTVEITADSGLKIRVQPDKASAVVGSAVQGTRFALTDSTIKQWYGIAGGYVSKSYARLVQVPQSKQYLRLEEHPNWFWATVTLSVLLVLGFYVYLGRLDRERLTLEINYEFTDEMARIHTEFLQAFGSLASSRRVWQYLNSERVMDKRRNSGADNSITRVLVKGIALNRKASAYLQTNVPVPYIGLRNTELFFFPERLVIKRGRVYAAVFYKNLLIEASNTRFIEEQTLPADATVIGQTWKYVNKNGGPDKRFSNNRQIPVCRYSEYTFKSATGVYEVITTSLNGAFDLFTRYVTAIGEAQNRMSIN